MATFSINSSATQTEAALPERGIVTGVAVDGLLWAWRQSGVDDSTIDFAPAIPAGRTVVVTYTPTPVPAVDLTAVIEQLATKATIDSLDGKADVSALNALADTVAGKADTGALALKADAAAVTSALSGKASTGAVDAVQADLDALEATVAGISVASGGIVESLWNSAIKLDLVGGRRLGDAGTPGLHTQVGNLVLTEGTGSVLDGNASFTIKLSGAHTLDYSAFEFKGPDTPVTSAARFYDFAVIKRHNAKPALYAVAGDVVLFAPNAATALAIGARTTTSLRVDFAASAADVSHSPATDYTAEWRTTAGPGAWNVFTDGVSTVPSIDITGLASGTAFDVRIKASNSVGSTYSAILSNQSTDAASFLTVTTQAPSSENVTAAGYLDWLLERPEGNWTRERKSGADLIVGPTFFASAAQGNGIDADGVDYTWTDGTNTPSGTTATAGASQKLEDTGDYILPKGVKYTAPAGLAPRKVKFSATVYASGLATATPIDLFVKFRLSDNSAPPVKMRMPHLQHEFFTTEFVASYQAANTGAYLEVAYQLGEDDGTLVNDIPSAQILWHRVTYGT